MTQGRPTDTEPQNPFRGLQSVGFGYLIKRKHEQSIEARKTHLKADPSDLSQ